jgi:hypothetical protein
MFNVCPGQLNVEHVESMKTLVNSAALCFTDSHVKDDNEQYLKEAFGNSDAFCILMRVPVQKDAALPHILRRADVLYEWSTETGARW